MTRYLGYLDRRHHALLADVTAVGGERDGGWAMRRNSKGAESKVHRNLEPVIVF